MHCFALLWWNGVLWIFPHVQALLGFCLVMCWSGNPISWKCHLSLTIFNSQTFTLDSLLVMCFSSCVSHIVTNLRTSGYERADFVLWSLCLSILYCFCLFRPPVSPPSEGFQGDAGVIGPTYVCVYSTESSGKGQVWIDLGVEMLQD